MHFSANDEEKLEEKVVQIRRVTKVVKGGKKMGFRAVVVVGDRKGMVGVGIGKAAEVSAAIRKGVEQAKKNQVTVPIVDGTVPHEVHCNFGASSVVIRPARPGRGVIAGGAMRIVLELSGLRDVVSKSLGSSNPVNLSRATVEGLKQMRQVDQLSQMRGKTISARLPGRKT